MADPLAESLASLCGALCGLRDQVQALATVHAAVDEFNGVFGAFQNAMALHASCLAFPAPPKPKPVVAPPPPRSSTGIPKPQIAIVAPPRAPSSSGSGGRPSDASGGATATASSAAGAKAKGGAKKRPSGGPSGAPSGPGPAKKKAPVGAIAPNAAPGGNKKKAPAKSRAAAAAQAQKNARPETAPWKWDKNVRDAIPRKYQSEGELAKLENVLIYLKNRQGGVTIADLVKHSGLAVIRCKEILQTLTKINLIARRQESAGFLYTFGPPEEE